VHKQKVTSEPIYTQILSYENDTYEMQKKHQPWHAGIIID